MKAGGCGDGAEGNCRMRLTPLPFLRLASYLSLAVSLMLAFSQCSVMPWRWFDCLVLVRVALAHLRLLTAVAVTGTGAGRVAGVAVTPSDSAGKP